MVKYETEGSDNSGDFVGDRRYYRDIVFGATTKSLQILPMGGGELWCSVCSFWDNWVNSGVWVVEG